jgi:two-component system alkaline phosphatase synthesis response regulator PhoP
MQPTILVVDDEHDIRVVARLGLQMFAGWRVLTADSGAECLITAEAEQPDVILLDWMMPHMDGPTTFIRLRETARTSHIPVIMLTAKTQAADTRLLMDMGVQGVLAKPFDPTRLGEQVSACLGGAL